MNRLRLTEQSDSRLPILFKCIGSALLQTTDSISPQGEAGSAIHEQLEARVKYGPAAAYAMIDEIVDKYDLSEIDGEITKARCRSFEFNPPEGSGAELALAWDLRKDKPEVIKVKGGKGSYQVIEGVGAPGTIDLVFAEPEPLYWEDGVARCPPGSVLWVCDYKSGADTWVQPVHRNAQVASAAAKAAIWTGAVSVIPAIIYVRKGEGIWEVVDEPWDLQKLAEVAMSVTNLHNRIAEARDAGVEKSISQFVEGQHCRYCDSLAYCPVKSESIRSIVSSHTIVPKAKRVPKPLSDEEASQLASVFPILKDLVIRVKEVLEAHADEHGDIQVGEGLVHGPVKSQRKKWDPEVALPILQDRLGDEHAHKCLKLSSSKVDEQIQSYHKDLGIDRQRAKWKREIESAVEAAGGISKVDHVEYRIHKRADTLPTLPGGKKEVTNE